MKRVKRLYTDFKPAHYELFLAPNRDSMTFAGTVKLQGTKTGRPSKRITLHQKGLKISQTKLTYRDKRRGATRIKLLRTNAHDGLDEIRLHAGQMLYPGEYSIEIEFSGKITEPMHGIYPCNYTYNGKPGKIIATQFESHHAREAFPCIDEPEAKATFSLTISAPKDEVVISNMLVKSKKTKDKLELTTFETTPVMSTYLLAFAYGDLKCAEGEAANGVTIRSWATPNNAGLLDYSLQEAKKTILFFEEYFDTPYPLGKLDLLALPDFSSGAMENWGLITFRETAMLIDPKHSGIETKQLVSEVIAHEIAHQWFGNLVTMRWWDDLWLNESFANLMEYQAVDAIHPDWNIWEHFINSEMNMAMRRDALPNVQPVRVAVNHPDELAAVFDPAIVYAKGSVILNMLMNFIGEDAFRAGLKTYFKKYAYSNTAINDLWTEMSKASHADVNSFMDSWLNKPGYPIVETDWTPGSSSFKTSQKRLVIGEGGTESIVWEVPLAASMPVGPLVLSSKNASIGLAASGNTPLLLNNLGKSYFVPSYTNEKHFELIRQALAEGQISTIDRILILMQSSVLEQAGAIELADNLKLISPLGNEHQESVWSSIGGVLASAHRLIAGDEQLEKKFNPFARKLVAKLAKNVGWEAEKDEPAQAQRLRNLALSLAAKAENPEVLKTGLEQAHSFKTPSDLSPDIRNVVYYIASRFGSQSDFNKLLDLYKTIDNADEKDELASALAATQNPRNIHTLLSMITTSDVRAQDAPVWFAWIMRNPKGTKSAWQWLKDNWNWVEKNYSSDKSYDRFARYAAMVFSTEQELSDYQKFFAPMSKTIALQRPIQLGIEEIAGRIKWRKRNEASFKKWLAAQA